MLFRECTAHSAGQLILFRKGVSCDVLNVAYESKRILAVNCSIDGKHVTVVNVYAPTIASENCAFFEELVDVIRSIQVEDVLICGDFNCVLDNELGVISDGKHAVSTVKKFNDILSD